MSKGGHVEVDDHDLMMMMLREGEHHPHSPLVLLHFVLRRLEDHLDVLAPLHHDDEKVMMMSLLLLLLLLLLHFDLDQYHLSTMMVNKWLA